MNFTYLFVCVCDRERDSDRNRERMCEFVTVRNEFEFPGDLSVGLPTLVQNPPTANDIANPTGLNSRLLLIGLPVKKKEKGKKKKLPQPGIDLTEQGSISIKESSALAIELWWLVGKDEFLPY